MAAVATCLALRPAAMVSANPVGPTVVNGNVTFATQGNLLSVTNTPGAIINWKQFSIGSNEATRFIQQSAASAILNRVVGVDPSQILGTLQSNGRVFLINPNGILFGAGTRIDVAGLVASTLNLSNEDFITGRMKFIGDPARAAAVVNQGRITASEGGRVYLIGSAVDNQGVITAPNGDVVLAAGKSVQVSEGATPGVQVEITAPADSTINLSELAYGSSGIYAGLVRNSGVISANSVVRGADGSIMLKASNGVTLESGSRVSANGLDGGRIVVDAQQGTAAVSGSVEAAGSAGHGGSIAMVGEQTGLFDGARVDASGANAGGTVLIGGDLHGGAIRDGDLALANSQRTYVAEDTVIRADAVTSGDGGKVIVWADDLTRYFGTISAKGGAQTGNGGFVETSGKLFLEMLGNVDASAPNGAGGMWLLDPANVTISTGATSNGTFSGGSPNVFATTANTSVANRNTIQTSLNGGTDVTILTTPTGTQAGNITVSSTITKSAGGNATLTLDAVGAITVNSAITATFGQLNTVLTAGSSITTAANITTNGGNIDITAGGAGVVSMTGGSFSTSGGNVTISSPTTVSLRGITTGTGNLNITSAGTITQPAGSLVIGGTTSLAAGAANNITLNTATNNFGGAVNVVSGNNVNLRDTNALDLGASTISGNLTVRTTGAGGLTQSGALAVTGTTSIQAGGNNVNLNLSNDFGGAVRIVSGNNITLNDINAFAFGNGGTSAISGKLTLTAGGPVTQANALTVAGTTSINAGANPITLTTGANNFTGAVSLNNTGANNVAVTDTNAIVLGASNIGSGTLTVNATGANSITQTGAIVQEASAEAAIFTTGGGAITLTQANDFTGPVSATNTGANNVSVTDANALQLGTISMGNAAGMLTVTSSGDITQSGATTITSGTGNVTFSAGAGAITLPNANLFRGSVALSNSGANNVSITDTNALSLRASTVGSGTLTVTAPGAITQTGAITQAAGAGTATFNAGTNAITLTQANDFTGAVSATNTGANNVAITDTNTITLGASTVGNNLAVTAGGAISQTGALTIPGTSTFTLTAANSDVLLNTAANNFTGAISFGGTLANVRDVAFRNTNAGASVPILSTLTNLRNLTLQFDNTGVSLPTATLHAGGNLAVTAGGAVTQTGPVIVPGTSNVNAGANAITLTNGSNDFTGAVTLTGGTTQITDSNTLALGASSVGALTAQTLTGDLTLNGAITATGGGDSIVLASAANFINTAGATPIDPGAGGRYLIYSTNPVINTFGGFASPGNLFGRTYTLNPPATISTGFGNRFVYSITPTLSVTADTGQNKVYGNADPGTYSFSVMGLVAGDTTGSTLTGALTRVAGENVGNYTIQQDTLADQLGYLVSYTSNNFAIGQRPVTVTADAGQSKVYGNADPASFTYTNTSLGTGTALVGSLTRNAGENVGSYAITQGGITNAANTNYSITYFGDNFAIGPAALTVTANNQSKTFGSTFIFTGNEFTSAGLQNSETIANVSLTSLGAPAPAPAGPYPIIASAAAGGTFTPSNYAITYVNGNLVVNSVPLSPFLGPLIQANNSSVLDPNTVAYGTSGSITIADATGFLNTLPPTAAGPEDGDEPAARFGEQPARRDQADRNCFVSGPLTFMACRNRR